MPQVARIYTATVTAAFTVSSGDGYRRLYIRCTAGTVDVVGNGSANGSASDAITLTTADDELTLTSDAALDGITITPAADSTAILILQ